MATALDSVLDRDLARRLARLDWHLRRVRMMRGLGWLAIMITLALAGAFVVDLLFKPGAVIRGLLLAGIGLGGLATFLLAVVRPVLRKHTSAELAAVVEHAHPELAERLTSAIELHDSSVPEEWRGSPLMREMLTRQTLRSVAPINFAASVSQTRALKASLGGLAALLLLVVPAFVAPETYGLLWSRLFSPWGNFETPGNLSIQVEGGDRVIASGDDLEIRAQVDWRYADDDSPPALRLHWRDSAGTSDSRQMQRDAETGLYSTTLTNIFHPLDFHVAAGRDRSRTCHVEVVDRPEVLTAVLDAQPPAYTGRPAQQFDGVRGEVRVFEHSRLELLLTFSKPVESAEWKWLHRLGGGPEARPAADGEESVATLPLVLADDRRSATLDLAATQGGAFAFDLVDAHGLHNSSEPERVLSVITDAPPQLALGGSSAPRKARPDDVVRVDVRATDDIGLGAVELHYEILRGEQGVIPVDPARVHGRELNHTFELNLTELGVQSGSLLSYRIRAADQRPAPEPNETWSEPRVISIDKEAGPPEATDVVERQQELRKLLDEIRRDLDQNQAQVADLHAAAEAAAADDEFPRDAEIPAAARDQRKLAERVEDFAGRLAEHPLYANLTGDAAAVGRETLEPAGRALEQAGTQPVPEKVESLQKNGEQLATADEQLADIAARFEDLARLEQELLELNRLARQAEQLAERALDLDRRRQEQPPDETPEQRAAREEQLRRDAEALAREHNELMRQLDSLLERRPEILEAARQSQLDRLAELSRQMRNLIEPQDLLAEALQQEAAAAANELAPLAERQQEMVRQAEELAARTDPRATRMPVQPLDPERLREALQALKAGDLAAAEERQQAAADELEQLAAELAKNEQLPADPQQAAEQLARRQRDLNERIQAAADDAPAADAGEDEQREFQNQLRGLAREQAGIQAGASALDVPRRSRESQQQAVDRAGDAVEQLLAGETQRAAEASQQAADALEELSQNVGSPAERTQQAREAVARLREQQQQLANEARQAAAAAQAAEADGEEPANEAAAQLGALAERQHEIAREVAELDAPGAEAEQRAAVRRQAAALTDLERQAAADVPASQSQAEEALERLSRRLDGEDVAPEIASADAEAGEAAEPASVAEQAEQLAQRQQELANRTERAAEAGQVPAAAERQQAGEQLAAIRRQAEQLRAGQHAAGAQRAALEQLRKADEARQRTDERARTEQPGDANAPAAEASDALQRLMQNEAQSHERAADALREFAEQLQTEESRAELARRDEREQEQLEQLAGEDGRAAPGNDTDQANANGAQQPGSPAGSAEDAARQARELAQQQRELAQQAAAARAAQEQRQQAQSAPASEPAGDQQANADQAAEADNAENSAAAENAQQPGEGGAPQEQPSPSAAQQQLAREAAELALDAARQTGPESEPAAQAAQFARESAQSAAQASQGRLGESAQTARDAAQAGQQAAEQLGEVPGEAGQQLQQRASDLAQRQSDQAEALEQASRSADARRAAQQAGQQQLAAETGQLAQQLAEIAENLGSQPLDLAEPAEQARSGQQAADSARESMQQAAGALQQGNPGQAAASAREAAEQLRQAAEQAGVEQEATPSDVPADVAGQVAEAARQLAEARRHLADAENAPPTGSQPGQPGSPAANQAGSPMTAEAQASEGGQPPAGNPQSGQTAAASGGPQSPMGQSPGGEPGQASAAASQPSPGSSPGGQPSGGQQPGQPGGQQAQGPAGAAPGTPLSQTARSLQEAARALAQVAGQAAQGAPSGSVGGQPGQSQSGSPGGAPGAQAGSTGDGSQLDGPLDPATLDQELQRLSSRQWGQLPGHLRTEILQAARQQANSDYERLIKLYFEEIARTRPAEPEEPPRD